MGLRYNDLHTSWRYLNHDFMTQWLIVQIQTVIYYLFVESRFLTPVTIRDRIYAGQEYIPVGSVSRWLCVCLGGGGASMLQWGVHPCCRGGGVHTGGASRGWIWGCIQRGHPCCSRGMHPGCTLLPCEQNDTPMWKYYLPASLRYAVGKNLKDYCFNTLPVKDSCAYLCKEISIEI